MLFSCVLRVVLLFLPEALLMLCRWSLFYCGCFSVSSFPRSNPVALASYCDPSLVATLLELLPEGSQIAPHIGALSAPARSSVSTSRALHLVFPSSRYHPTLVDGVAGKATEF